MAVKLVRGHLILETVGPSCHLVGWLQRDTQYPNRLILTRTSDALSPQVRALAGRWLPTLKITDPTGKSATMSNVSFIDTKPIQSQAVGSTFLPGSEHSEHDTSYLEDSSFTFQSITVENLMTSTSTSDDIVGWPPPHHRRRDTKAIGTVCP